MLYRILALAALAGPLMMAQSTVGSISGTVTDSSGAAVPDCAVSATNDQTGQKITVQTQDTGLYVFASLASGSYTLVAEKAGFRVAERTDVLLDAASRRTVDFTLEVGAVSETVNVAAAAEQVQTSSGDIGRLINNQQLNEISLNGRNYSQLLRLIPGAVATNLDPFTLALSTTGQRINGVRSDSIYFTFDGIENMDNGGMINAAVNPNADSIAEVKILTASYSAEFGGRSGALVNVVTKSGTREFHGTLFEFVRNDSFDARSFFARQVDPLRFNDFGYTLGGPVYIPHKWNADRNKLFFFLSQEWKYTHLGQVRLGQVPTQGERNGDYRTSTLPAPIDPLNGQPFPDRIVPAARWSKNGPALLKPLPLPNFDGPGGNYATAAMSRTDPRELLLRFDYLAPPKTQISGRWTHDEWEIFDAFQGSSLGIVPGFRPRPAYVPFVSVTHSFSPTTLNYFSFGISHDIIRGDPQNAILRRSALGITFPEIYPPNRFGIGPNLNISGFSGYNGGDRIKKYTSTFQWRDDFSKVIGAHNLKLGAQITRSRTDENIRLSDQGEVTFNTSAQRTTRNVIADVLLGNFQNYTEGTDDAFYFGRFNQFEFYFQDSWKVRRNLTLELGVRYNFLPPWYNVLGDTSTFLADLYNPAKAVSISPADGSILPNSGDPYNGLALFGSGFPDPAKGRIAQASDPSLQRLFVGLPRSGYGAQYRDISPRIGFAWDPFGHGKTSVRGGYGIFYDRTPTNTLIAASSNPPFAGIANIFDGNIDNPGGGTARSFPPNLTVFPRQLKTPSIMSYNVGIQHELPHSLLVDIAYVGNLGRHLARSININQLQEGARLNPPASNINVNALRPYLGYGSISVRDQGDNSNYNSLQVAVSRRIRQGFSVTANYTFSKALDDTSGTPQNAFNSRPDYGLSAVQRAHVLNVNYIYELPFLRHHPNALVRKTLAGWEISGVTFYQSGAPNTISVPVDVGRIGAGSTRAIVIGDPNLPKDDRTLARWFNTE